MKRYQLLLAYYTLIITVVLFFWSIFFTPKPLSFLLTLLVAPTGIYFWLLVTGTSKPQPSEAPIENQKHKGQPKFPFVVLMTLFISSFSIFIYSEITNRSSLNSQLAVTTSVAKQIGSLKLELGDQNKAFRDDMVKELKTVKNELANIKSKQKVTKEATVMGDTTLQVGTITIADKKYPTANVYQEKILSSSIVGKIEFGKTYTFIEKTPDWYLVLIGEKEGYVSNQFVKEVQYEK